MKKYLPRIALGLVVLLILLAHSARVVQIGFISHLDAIMFDAKVRLTMPRSIDERVVILDIDEKSLAVQGRWPWNRATMGAILDKLFDYYGVRMVGFDVVFAEADNSSGMETLESLASNRFRGDKRFQDAVRELRPQLNYDARFARAMRGREVVLGYYFSAVSGGVSSGQLPAPVLPAMLFEGRNIAFSRWSSFGGNLALFQSAAAAAGHFNPLVDFDGLSRRIPMLAEHEGQYYESLSLAMVRRLLGATEVVPGFPTGADDTYGGMEWLDIRTAQGGTLRIPVDENVATLIPWHGYRGSFPYYAMSDVLAGTVAKDKLAQRIVLVGTTAPGLMDLRATPVDTAYPGVEVHANMITGMLDGSIKYKPPYIMGADVLIVLSAGLLLIFVLPRLPPLRATMLSLIVLLVLLAINVVFWYQANVVLPLAGSLLMVVVLFAINMSWGYFVESRSKRLFAALFGQYVPPELVDEMARNPEGYSMAGRKAELTVLFSDIRGFTTLSEGLPPDQLAALMNEYLGAMTQVIQQNRGTLDKYIGDAIMAFWGAPVNDAQHAAHATLTALQMQSTLRELNQRLLEHGWPELKIGVGVNTGVMTVGDMGSPVRKAYTVLGDAVNLGSRLEGITKQYGVGVIVGEETYQLLRDAFVFRELDRVRVKGKAEPVGIYEPLGLPGQVAAPVMAQLAQWQQALNCYRRQQWDAAEALLAQLQREAPHYLFTLYAERITRLRAQPPGDAWDGITTFETK